MKRVPIDGKQRDSCQSVSRRVNAPESDDGGGEGGRVVLDACAIGKSGIDPAGLLCEFLCGEEGIYSRSDTGHTICDHFDDGVVEENN